MTQYLDFDLILALLGPPPRPLADKEVEQLSGNHAFSLHPTGLACPSVHSDPSIKKVTYCLAGL